MRISPRIFVFIILAALLFGCAGEDMLRYEPAPPPPDEAQVAVRLLASGEKAFAAGELDRASAIFTDFLGRYPGQPGADLAWLRHGQIQLAKDFPEGAKESL